MSTEAIITGVLGVIIIFVYKYFSYIFADNDEYLKAKYGNRDRNGSRVSNDREVLLNLKKDDSNEKVDLTWLKKDNLYDYSFPELLKERYQKERGKSDSDFQLVQLALKDWFSIFAGSRDSTNRTAFYDFPSKEVDELWHLFILFTKDYREFCQKYLGQFLDYVPLESKNIEYPNLINLVRTYDAVKNKNDCLLFKIDDMFEYKNRSKFQYSFMKQLEGSLHKLPSTRTRQEGIDLYNYGLISYTESRAMIPPEKPKSSATRSSIGSSGSKTIDDDIITSSCESSSCGTSCESGGGCGS
jgi:hypothetical protein